MSLPLNVTLQFLQQHGGDIPTRTPSWAGRPPSCKGYRKPRHVYVTSRLVERWMVSPRVLGEVGARATNGPVVNIPPFPVGSFPAAFFRAKVKREIIIGIILSNEERGERPSARVSA